MTAAAFLDTNILIYAASRLRTDARKKWLAAELIASAEFGTSGQVPNHGEEYGTIRAISPFLSA